MKTNYNRTVQACFIGYVVQAILNNFVHLLFLTFQGSYGISLQKITLLVTFNFGIQLLVDLASIGFVDRIGYRASMILALIRFIKRIFSKCFKIFNSFQRLLQFSAYRPC